LIVVFDRTFNQLIGYYSSFQLASKHSLDGEAMYALNDQLPASLTDMG